MAALAVGTSLPWIASFAMPDIFAAVLIMAATLLLFYRDRLRRWEHVCVWLLLFASILFHGSHSLLMLALLPVAFGLGWLLKMDAYSLKRFAGMALVAVAVATLAAAGYAAAIQAKTGDEFRRPPFMIARVLADGPGRAYLRYSCPRGAHLGVLPLPRPAAGHRGSYPLVSGKGRRGVQPLQLRRPRGDGEAGVFLRPGHHRLRPAGRTRRRLPELGRAAGVGLVEDPLRRPMVFLMHNYWGKTNLVGLIRGVGPCGKQGELCQPNVTITELMIWNNTVLVLAILALVLAVVQPDAITGSRRRIPLWGGPVALQAAATLFILYGDRSQTPESAASSPGPSPAISPG